MARANSSPRWSGAGTAAPARRAVLALHGYTDYFFNTELADHFAARGFAFYALDLHKCGRSRRNGQTPHFTTNLASYDAELDRALTLIADDTAGARVCMYGHSAGGLIAPLWLDRLRAAGRHRVEHRTRWCSTARSSICTARRSCAPRRRRRR